MKNKLNLGSRIKHVHFIGIGGISMSGLAEILHRDGYKVSGSDWTGSDITKHLASQGINVRLGNSSDHITDDIDLMVYTAAVKPDNPEFVAARQKNIPVMDRAKLLGIIMEGYPYSIAISGVHGKTTTTAIVAEMLLKANLDPTISIGGFMGAIGSNFRIGGSPYLVVEACEYFDSFLQFHPFIGVILNIDSDHLDYFGTLERLVDSFHRFGQNIRPEGTLVIHKDTPFFDEVTAGLKCNIVTYGGAASGGAASGGASSAGASSAGANNITGKKACFWPKDIQFNENGLPSFSIMDSDRVMDSDKIIDSDKSLGKITLQLRGCHNIDNALAAVAVASALDIPIEPAIKGISQASGAKRRFEHKGTFNDLTIVDDYAHHPTEIKASLAAACGTHKRIICAFQSHTYSRTQNLLEDFSAAFNHADIVLILPIYAAREVSTGPYPNYLAERLTEGICNNGTKAFFMDDFPTAASWLKKNGQEGDLLITMGAGDIHLLGEGLLAGVL